MISPFGLEQACHVRLVAQPAVFDQILVNQQLDVRLALRYARVIASRAQSLGEPR